MGSFAKTCARIADSRSFQLAVVVVILANAVVIGLETYDSIEQDYGALLGTLNDVFLGLFTVELAIRVAAYGRRPQGYFRSGWNVFDFLVVALAYVPWLRESVTLLRVIRLLRIVRLITVVPGLRVVIVGLGRSIAPIGSIALLTFFLLYIYGIVGWIIYADHDPEQFGNIGRALLTLFQVLTLEGWNEVLAKEMELTPWSWVYFVSFVLFATFIVLNVVIAVVVNSIEEAHQIEDERKRLELLRTDPDHASLYGKIEALKQALEDLEQEVVERGKRA
jgi:voltage-gated sodium channel